MKPKNYTIEILLICILLGIFMVYYYDIDIISYYQYLLKTLGLYSSNITKYQSKKKQDHLKEIQTLKQLNDKHELAGLDTSIIKRSLFNRYFNGVPDTYDQNGTKLPGKKPDILLAIKYLQETITDKTNKQQEKDLDKLAFIYKHGAYDFKPDPIKGSLELETLKWTVKEEHHNLINDLVNDLQNGIPDDTDTEGLPDSIPVEEIRIENNIPDTVHRTRRGDTDPYNIFNTDINEQELLFRIIEENRNRNRIPINTHNHNDNNLIVQQIKDDSQNVHDSSVVNSTRNSINKLKQEVDPIITQANTEINKNQIYEYLHSLPKTDKIKDAIRALDYIYSKNAINNSLNVYEVEALNLVWPKIANNKDSMDIFVYELSSMIENNLEVCSTGRVARIIDTLNTIDDTVKIVPESIIQQDSMNKAAMIRTNFYNSFNNDIINGSNGTDLLNNGTHPNQIQIDNDLRNKIKEELRIEYVSSGIMLFDKFEKMINEWINDI